MGKRSNADGGQYVTAGDVAEQLSISLRHAEDLCRRGVFGPRLKLGHRTIRVRQAGVDAYLRHLERRDAGTAS